MTPAQIKRMRSYIAALLRHGHLPGFWHVSALFLDHDREAT